MTCIDETPACHRHGLASLTTLITRKLHIDV